MKGIFGPYVLRPFDKKVIFQLVKRITARDCTVCEYCQREFKCQVSHLQMNFFATLSFTIIDKIASGLKCTAVQAPFLIF